VLLVTKAVGDFLGTTGIADEMIRFNGFPFLEKQEHSFNVSGKVSHRLTTAGLKVGDFSVTGHEDRTAHIVRIGDVCSGRW
jgi:chloride channel 3/4/5